jgi:hypothetical protein
MMKKKGSLLLLTAIAFLLFANTGYAKAVTKKITAVFGSYVIKLDGKTQKTETLATGSKVYIPINDVTALTGATIKKTGTTYTITPVKKDDGINQTDIEALQFYSEIQNLYSSLEYLGSSFYELSNTLDVAFNEIEDKGTTDFLNNEALSDLNKYITEYNDFIDIVDSKINKAKKLKLNNQNDEKHLNQILDLLSQSIDSYKLAFEDIDNYASGAPYSFANEKKAYQKALEAQDIAYKRAMVYYNLIQNYK